MKPPETPPTQKQSPIIQPNAVFPPVDMSEDDPDFAEEFTTAGVDRNYWKKPIPEEGRPELLT